MYSLSRYGDPMAPADCGSQNSDDANTGCEAKPPRRIHGSGRVSLRRPSLERTARYWILAFGVALLVFPTSVTANGTERHGTSSHPASTQGTADTSTAVLVSKHKHGSPAIADGTLFLRTVGHLYAFAFNKVSDVDSRTP